MPNRFFLFLLATVPAAAQLDRIPPPNTNSPLVRDPASIANGERRFRDLCTACHGRDGQGGQGEGQGPNLMNSWEVRRAKDQQLFDSVRNGVKGTAMPPFALPEREIWELVAYVRSLNAPAASVSVAGNATAGERIFFGRGRCAECHMVRGRGGYLGPDLTNLGSTRRVSEIRAAILNPPPLAGEGWRPLLLTTPGRPKLRAVARHMSSWSIQALDEEGAIHLLEGDAMKNAELQKTSWMTGDFAGKLAPGDIDDVVAFLSRAPAGASAVSVPDRGGVTSQDLLQGPGRNWLTYIGDYSAQRHSPLTEIDRNTVARLAPKWVRHFDTANDLETVPLVENGIMYATGPNEMVALDAATGREIWRYRAVNAQRRGVNRGAGILGERVFFMTADCHLVALRRTTGAVAWDREYASSRDGYSCTGAPLIVKDKVIVGVASSGRTCFIAALSAETGDEIWRVWAVPKKGEPGSETWGGFPLERGGGPTWTTGSYDPSLNLLYWPTGNPWPDFGGDRPGDNLYTDCILALDADTGKMKWHFQFVPHDTHDWDANETPVLLDADYAGRPRKLLLQANRNGLYYVLDRTTGEFLRGVPFVKELNWAKGLDDKGRPMVLPNTDPSPGGVRICPSVHGATNWWSPSLNPGLGLFFVVALEQCETYYSSAQEPVPNSGFRGTGHTLIPGQPGQFYLRALDAKTGVIRWEFPMPGPTTMWGGTVSTAGGLVFSSDDDGDLLAVDAASGAPLWHFYTGATMHASPMTFSAGGRQYVSVAAGTNLFTFALVDGNR